MRIYINKIILQTAILLGMALGSISCTDYLDKAPLSEIDPNDAYKNFQNFQGFTEELYNCIPVVTGNASHNSWDWGEDVQWIPNDTRSFSYRVDQGDYWEWDSGGDHYGWLRGGGNPSSDNTGDKGRLWGLAWYGIRKANIGLSNLDKLTEATQEEKDLIEGQLYFFRGWFHFMIMQFWGGLPYIDEVLPSDQVLKLPRLSYQETADKASEDFKRAAALLPLNWDDTKAGQMTSGNNAGRINKIMALVYLGKNELWAGSPLMNKGVNANGLTDYNTEYCKRAADAFAEVLDLCDRTGRYQLASFEEYSSIFYTHKANGRIPGLKEAIFQENLMNASGRYRWNQVNDYVPKTLINSGVKHYPSANYVDYYGTKSGYPITDPESGWSNEYPWKDRDPRFYTDIRYDGVKMALNTAGNLTEDRQYASLYTGGLYRTSNGMEGILSGYMMSKFMHPMTNEWDGTRDNIVAVLSFVRLADVYLMYAEAALMGYGSITGKGKVNGSDYKLTALDAVNTIRNRAGVAEVPEKFCTSQTIFLNELRRERAVELAFEGHRFTDLRRWLLLDKAPYNVKMLVDFDRAGDVSNEELYKNPENGHVLNWSYSVLKTRNLSQKHYWLPFRREDVNMYKEFEQNPGW